MDVAQKLLDELPRWVKLQKDGAAKLKELATEMENRKKKVTVSKVVGSSASVAGAAVMTAAGVLTIFTGGLAAPLLVAGAVATGADIVTNVGADIGGAVGSRRTIKEAEEVSQKIEETEKNIQDLMKTLTDEQQKDDQLPADNYVMERILRAMAKRTGLTLPHDVSLGKIMSRSFKCHKFEAFSTICSSILRVLSTVVLKTAAKQTGTSAVSVAAGVGGKAAVKAAGRIAGGAVGLGFSITELVNNCKDLDSQSLRENAEDIQKAAEELETQLHETEKLIERLARVKLAIETAERSSGQKKDLLEFAIQICEDETIQQWLRENAAAFFHLTDMFNLVREHIEKHEKTGKSDIIFVAHRAVEDEKHPAACLLPLSNITDVLLYSPWNCAIDAEAAYGIATGCMQPQHRDFYCGNRSQCKIPNEGHRPRKLPNDWNSMKKAEAQSVPKIIVQSLKPPNDGFWNDYISLTETHGQPHRSRIVIPFLNPGAPLTVTFYVVTLALSLALYFSKYEATVHLAACLCDISTEKFDREFLEDQYSYTIDHSVMTCPEDIFPARDTKLQRLYTALQDVFDNIHV